MRNRDEYGHGHGHGHRHGKVRSASLSLSRMTTNGVSLGSSHSQLRGAYQEQARCNVTTRECSFSLDGCDGSGTDDDVRIGSAVA